MNDIVGTRPIRLKGVSAAEMDRRRAALSQADASSRIEGQFRSAESAAETVMRAKRA